MKSIFSVISEVLKAFFDIEDKIMSKEGAKKVSFTAVGRAFYGIIDYLIAAGLGAMVFWMNARSFSGKDIYLATFLYDFIAAAGFYWLSDMTGCDITLGQSFRRVMDVMHQKGFYGKISAWLLAIGISVKAIIWEGPEVICFLFQKELKKRENIWLSLFVLSALQGIFGTWLYTTGYNLWEKFGSQYFKTESDVWALVMGVGFFVVFLIGISLVREIWQFLSKLWRKLA
jgi:small basic protein